MTTILLSGVGGQGTILASDVLAKVAAAEGLDVKLSEVHGMSQRGGSVDTAVRFGEEVYSPVTDAGAVDALVAFELLEGARWAHWVAPEGSLFVNTRRIDPLSVMIGDAEYPEDLEARLTEQGAILLDADALACEAGSPRSTNIVMLGALSSALPFETDRWCAVIEGRVPPATVEANLRAFDLGRGACDPGGRCMG
jgi:indolepyruvate ferredoxin oxidoreductase beta subunit